MTAGCRAKPPITTTVRSNWQKLHVTKTLLTDSLTDFLITRTV